MYTIFNFEKEMDENKIHQDFEKVRSRFTTSKPITNTTTSTVKTPSYWDRQSVEKKNKGLCDELLDSMW